MLASPGLLRPALTLIFALCPNVVLAQTLINGQIYTNGLSIINSPALNSLVFHCLNGRRSNAAFTQGTQRGW